MSAGLIAAATLGAGFLNTAGSVYTNAVNSATQQRINEQNAQLQWAINADQIEAARMNNETAINLANTAHQREVMDLRDANLNPILSAHGNGSAVPALDTPGLEAPTLEAPTVSNPLSGLANSLASAVQVNDAHNLNEARISALGFNGDSQQRKELSDALAEKSIAEANSARKAADALGAESRLKEIKSYLEANAFEDIFHLPRVREGYEDEVRRRYKDVYDMVSDSIIADYNSRRMKNTSSTFQSAKGIYDWVLKNHPNWLPNFAK